VANLTFRGRVQSYGVFVTWWLCKVVRHKLRRCFTGCILLCLAVTSVVTSLSLTVHRLQQLGQTFTCMKSAETSVS